MIYLVGLVVLALIVYGIVKAASGDRYSKMTEEEFEREAKRSSLMGAGVAEFQKVIDPATGWSISRSRNCASKQMAPS